MMAGMAALQVLVVRFFFQGARKGEFKIGSMGTMVDVFRIRVKMFYAIAKEIHDIEMSDTMIRSILQFTIWTQLSMFL